MKYFNILFLILFLTTSAKAQSVKSAGPLARLCLKNTADIWIGLTPVIMALATIALYAAVSQWNAWYDTAYFTTGNDLTTLSWILMRTVKEQSFADMANDMNNINNMGYNPEGVKMATMVVAAVPIIMIYPFLQRFFVKGLMVGSIKG